MQVSFIIPLFNCLPLTQAMLASLRATLPPGLDHEIIFVDDCSTDGTREWLAALRDPAVRVVLNEKNLGFAANNNHGAALARGEFLALLNNDLVLLPGWFEPMLEVIRQKPAVGFVGNVQINARTRQIDHRGVRFDLLGRPIHVQRRWALGSCSRYRAVTAACCLLRAPVFRDNGGFDTAFRNGYEDVDFCLRLDRAGFRHYVANRSRVLHHVSASPTRHAREDQNLRLFLSRWGREPTFRQRGLAYLQRYWDRPWRFNGPRLCLALAWAVTGRPCDGFARRLETTIKL
ncbi:MAG TPA: glycosyltransferase family 2 protein [Opitutaceae bacterium]|nr:glycosyltransferase family 2 protein [Opitutaceae bacterium]